MGNSYNWHRRGDSLCPGLRPDLCNALILSVPAMQVQSFSALCRLFGISRKTGYKWLERFDPSDLSSLSDRSRAPHSHSRTVP
ncbi:leucine zipper domain-containing protein, partial [Enterobacter cloacae]